MKPISPVISNEFVPSEVVYAKDQPEYIHLPVLRSPDGAVLSRWELTDQERAAIAAGADIWLYVLCMRRPLQPVRIEVAGVESSVTEAAEFMGLVEPCNAQTRSGDVVR